ncbi:MAG: hypothetical protein MJ211_06650 [Bacteroidales bacterium]|nr:hypothetical protein [Bacteroidales bacterium]
MIKTLVSDYPWYCPLICFLVAILLTSLLYYKNNKISEFQPFKIYILFILRFLSLFLSLLLLLNIFVKTETHRTEKPVLAFVVDNSNSMVMRGKGAEDSLKMFTNSLLKCAEELKENFNIQYYKFGNELVTGKNYTFVDKNTDFSQMFESLTNRLYNTNANSLVLCSDGICNKGQNPIYSATNSGFKIFTIALGDTTQYRDLAITKSVYNETSFLGNEFPIEIVANARMLKGNKTSCEIYHNGKKIFSTPINITSDSYTQNISTMIKADEKGLQKYTIVLNSIENEITTVNNSREIVVDIVDDKYKILILSDSPHPDVAAIRSALSFNLSYEVEVATAENFNEKPITGYNLIILVQLPNTNIQLTNKIKEISKKGTPLIYVLGNKTSISKFNEINSTLEIIPSGNNYEDASASVDAGFPLFTIENGVGEYLSKAPPLNCSFGTYNLHTNAKVLAYQKIKGVQTSKPLILVSDPSIKKEAIIVGEGIWKWRIDCYKRYRNHETFDLLISRIVQLLISKDNKEQFTITVKRIFSENEPVCFSAQLLDKEMNTIDDATITLKITDEKNKTSDYKLNKINNGYSLRIDSLKSGNYTYIAEAEYLNHKLKKSGSFSILEISSESQDLLANHNVLNKISSSTGGKMFFDNQLDELKTTLLNQNIKPTVFTDTVSTGLIDCKWPFFIILILLSLEWFLRKYWGTL